MRVPGTLLDDLRAIDHWATNAPSLPPEATNDDYMTVAMEVMNHTHFLQRVGVLISPTQKHAEKGVAKRRAIVLGHLVRIYKLYDALRYHTSKRA
jgi:hypothetical protein